MKQKITTLIITLIAILSPLLIMPEIYYENYNILKLITLLICGFILLIVLLSDYKNLKTDKKDILLLVFLGLIIISTFLSNDIKKSIIGETNRYEGLLMFVVYICIYFCSKKYFEYKKISNFLNIMFYISVLIAILGILQRNINSIDLYPIFNKGICSTFGHSNFFGSYISLILPIALSIFIINGNKKSFILTILMFFNLISSGTRSAWVAFAVVSLIGIIYLIKQKNKEYFKRAITIFLVFLVIFIYLFNGVNIITVVKNNSNRNNVVTNDANLNNSNDNNFTEKKVNEIINDVENLKDSGISEQMGSYRIKIWEMTLELIMKKPIFGCGTDNLKTELIQNCPDSLLEYAMKTESVPDKAHNEYLQIAATIGIPSIIIYSIFIILVLCPKIKLAKNNKIYFIISLTIISYLVQAFFNISTIGVAPIFWMLLGLSENKEMLEKMTN